jgi:hypothetical protein
VQRNGLGKKDSVYIEPTENNELVVKTVKSGHHRSQSIRVNIDQVDSINQLLVFCYVKNVNHLTLWSKTMTYETIKTVRSTLRYLEGYDITSETEKEIEITFLFHDVNINMRKMVQRILYLLRLQIVSLEKKDVASMDENEMAIDRLYHLSKRILFACIHNYRLRVENDIKNEEDLFFLKDIVKKLENIADAIYRIRDQAVGAKEVQQIRAHIDYLDSVLNKKARGKELRSGLERLAPSAKEPVIKAALQRIHELCRDVLENFVSIEFDRTYFADDTIIQKVMREKEPS